MTLESQIVASLQQMGDMQANAPPENQVFNTERVLAQAHSQFEQAQARPLINIVQSVPQQEAGTGKHARPQPVGSPRFHSPVCFPGCPDHSTLHL